MSTTRRPARARSAPLSVERLEPRHLPAGSVTAALAGGILMIEGTDGPDAIALWQSRGRVQVIGQLIEAGGSIIIIEHNLDVIKSADWIIDLGPEGGDEGGNVVAEGSPEAIAEIEASHTGRYLRGVLKH